jgi:hypothetical protein
MNAGNEQQFFAIDYRPSPSARVQGQDFHGFVTRTDGRKPSADHRQPHSIR